MSGEDGEQRIPSPNSAQEAVRGPRVAISEQYNQKDAKYTVEIDKEKWRNLLVELGMNDKGIDQLTIAAERRTLANWLYATRKPVLGQHNPLIHALTVYTDPAWKEYIKQRKVVHKIAEGKTEADENAFRGLLKTRRLARYLQHAKPTEKRPDRGIVFAEKLLLDAVNKALTLVAVHESEHAAQDDRGEFENEENSTLEEGMKLGGALGALAPLIIELQASNSFYLDAKELGAAGVTALAGAAIGSIVGLRIGYRLDLKEKGARKSTQNLKDLHRYIGLVTLTPKEIKKA